MPDELIKHCPTCGQRLFGFPFVVGDKVRHMNGKEGVVDQIGASVGVKFDGYHGTYDRDWFKAYPDGLTKI